MKSMIPALCIVLLINTAYYSQKDNSSSLKISAINNNTLSTVTSPNNINTITWSPLIYNGYNGVSGRVNALAVSDSSVYVGGAFTSAGGSTHRKITLWNGSSWTALGTGVNNDVYAVAFYGGNLIVGGIFDEAGGNNSISNLAKWNDTSWSALGGIVNAGVYALATSGSNLYAGGLFSINTGGSPANYIAKWDGNNWTNLGTGLNGKVQAIAVSGSNVYAGGTFINAGENNNISYLAMWNDTSWSALGAGVNGPVNAIEISGTDVYVGGSFTTAGGIAASYIAKLSGSSWSKLGNEIGSEVNAIKVSGSDVYAGTNATIKKYSGVEWSTVGAGTGSTVYALTINTTEGAMYVGGIFTSAGGSTANRIAKFTDTDNPLPVELTSFTGRRNRDGIELNWITATEVNNYGFEIERTALPTSMQQSFLRKWSSITFVQGYGNSNSEKQYSYTDYCKTTEGYTYRLKQIDTDGGFSYSTEVHVPAGNPARFELLQNYPNPFNPATDIKFSLPVSGVVKLEIYNLLGIKIATVMNEVKEAGEYSVPFEAKGLPSGIYLYRFQSGDFTQVKKMTLLK